MPSLSSSSSVTSSVTSSSSSTSCCCGDCSCGLWVEATPCADAMLPPCVDDYGNNWQAPCIWIRFSVVKATLVAGLLTGECFQFWNSPTTGPGANTGVDKRWCYSVCNTQTTDGPILPTPVDLPVGAIVANNIVTNSGCAITQTCLNCPNCCGNSGPVTMEVTVSGLQWNNPFPDNWQWSGTVPGATLNISGYQTPVGFECYWSSVLIPDCIFFTDFYSGITSIYGAVWGFDGNELICSIIPKNADGTYGPGNNGTCFWGFTNNFVYNYDTETMNWETSLNCNNPGSCLNGFSPAFGGSCFQFELATVQCVGTASLIVTTPDLFRVCGGSSSSYSSSSSSSPSSSSSSSSSTSSSSSSSRSSSSGNNTSSSSESSGGGGGGGGSSSTTGSSSSSSSSSSARPESSSSQIGQDSSSSSNSIPGKCFCCQTQTLVVSGSDTLDGTYYLTGGNGYCYWQDRSGKYQLFINNYAWVVQIIEAGKYIQFYNSDYSICPPISGWEVWSNTDGGTPTLTISCATSSSSSSVAPSCMGSSTCGYCSSTPSQITVSLSDVLMFAGCLSCNGDYYSVNSGSVNGNYSLLQNGSNSCEWILTKNSPVQIVQYFDSDCTTGPTDVTGTMSFVLSLTSPYSSLLVKLNLSNGKTLQVFGASWPFVDCLITQNISNGITAAYCNSDSVETQAFGGYSGVAYILPCSGVSYSSSSSNCNFSSLNLYNTGQYYVSGLDIFGNSCDVDMFWQYNGANVSSSSSSSPENTNACLFQNTGGGWYDAIDNTPTSDGRAFAWITPQCNGNSLNIGLNNNYSTVFTIPSGTNLSTLTLSGLFATDNGLNDIKVNGVSIDNTDQVNYIKCSTLGCEQQYVLNLFTVPSSANFVIGLNTINFNCYDDGGYGGFLCIWDNVCQEYAACDFDCVLLPNMYSCGASVYSVTILLGVPTETYISGYSATFTFSSNCTWVSSDALSGVIYPQIVQIGTSPYCQFAVEYQTETSSLQNVNPQIGTPDGNYNDPDYSGIPDGTYYVLKGVNIS